MCNIYIYIYTGLRPEGDHGLGGAGRGDGGDGTAEGARVPRRLFAPLYRCGMVIYQNCLPEYVCVYIYIYICIYIYMCIYIYIYTLINIIINMFMKYRSSQTLAAVAHRGPQPSEPRTCTCSLIHINMLLNKAE